MHRLANKLLMILLTLSLGLAPLQGTFASFSGGCDHDGDMHQSVDNDANSMMLITDQMGQDCPHCDAVADCTGQCSSLLNVFAALLPDASYFVKSAVVSIPPTTRDIVVSQIPSLLFRPPKS